MFDPVARDGVHTFNWYVARYLRAIRLDHPTYYDRLVGDSCWRRLTLAVWGRSERYLELTRGLDGLGSQDNVLLAELRDDPTLVQEIERLRQQDGC